LVIGVGSKEVVLPGGMMVELVTFGRNSTELEVLTGGNEHTDAPTLSPQRHDLNRAQLLVSGRS